MKQLQLQLPLDLPRTDLRPEKELDHPIALDNIDVTDNQFYKMRFDGETVHPNYLINRSGDIYSLSHKIIRKQSKRGGISDKPYLRIEITNPHTGNRQTLNSHRFVAFTFLIPSDRRTKVHHLSDALTNGVKNNHIDNLEWNCLKSNTRKGLAARQVKAFALEMSIVEWLELLHGLQSCTADISGEDRLIYRKLCRRLRHALTAEIAIEQHCLEFGLNRKLLELYEDSIAAKSAQLKLF